MANPQPLAPQTREEMLELLRTPVRVEGLEPPEPDPAVIERILLEHIPGLDPWLENSEAVMRTTANYLQREHGGVRGVSQAGAAASWLLVGMKALDVILLPAAWLTAWYYRKKPPGLNDAGKFALSATLLGLALTAVLFPPSAPFIGAGFVFMALGEAAWSLREFFKARKDSKALFEQCEVDISQEKQRLEALRRTETENLDDAELGELLAARDECTNRLTELYKTRELAKEEYNALDNMALNDKLVSLVLAAVSVIGLGLILPFGIWGVGIMWTAAVLGLGYFIGTELYSWFFPKAGKAGNPVEQEAEPDPDAQQEEQLQQAQQSQPVQQLQQEQQSQPVQQPQQEHEPNIQAAPPALPASSSIVAITSSLAPNVRDSLLTAMQVAELENVNLASYSPEALVGYLQKVATVAESHENSTHEVMGFLRGRDGFQDARDEFIKHFDALRDRMSPALQDLVTTLLFEYPIPSPGTAASSARVQEGLQPEEPEESEEKRESEGEHP